MKFRKRITTTVPAAIAGGIEAAALANAGVGSLKILNYIIGKRI